MLPASNSFALRPSTFFPGPSIASPSPMASTSSTSFRTKSRTTDFEIFEIESVTGYGANPGDEQEIPAILSRQRYRYRRRGLLYHQPRAAHAHRERTRKSQSFHLRRHRAFPFARGRQQRSLSPRSPRVSTSKALCTNRHLPIQMAVGAGQKTDFSMGLNAPVNAIRCVTTPTLPKPSHTRDVSFGVSSATFRSTISRSLTPPKVTKALPACATCSRSTSTKTIAFLCARSKASSPSNPSPSSGASSAPGPIAFARGLEITLTFDETAFEGVGVFILGAVLEQFFAKYVSLNSFTETIVRTRQRGEIIRWPTRMGIRQIL